MIGQRLGTIPMRQKPLLSVEEAAEVLSLSRSSLYRSIQRGDVPLPLFRINGRYRVARRAVEALLDGVERRRQPVRSQPETRRLPDADGLA